MAKTDLSIRIEMSDNGGIIVNCMDMDEPSEDKKYTFSSTKEALAKIKSLMEDEDSEYEDTPTTKEEVKKSLHEKSMGTTAKQMKGAGY